MNLERQVWRISRAGSLERLRLVVETAGAPRPGEVRVGVRAVGLNFADVFACLGLYSATPSGEFTPGLEFAGVVEEVGPVSRGQEPSLSLGDHVMGVTRFGGYATRLNVDARYLRRFPEGWSFAEAAAFGVQTLTAWYALFELGNLQKGRAVLVHSAAGGVGLQALSILDRTEALAVATVGSPSKKDFLTKRRGLREEQVIVRDRQRFLGQLEDSLRRLGLDGLDIVLDSVAGPYFLPGYQMLRRGGRIVLYGAADWMPAGARPNYVKLGWRYLRRPRLDPLQMIADNKSLMAFNLIWLWDRVDLLAELLDDASRVLRDPPWVGRSFPFAEAPAALRFLQSGTSIGKVVLEIGAEA